MNGVDDDDRSGCALMEALIHVTHLVVVVVVVPN